MEENWLPKGYCIKENGNLTSLFREGVLVFYSFRKVEKEKIKDIINQIEEAKKLIGVA